MGVQDRFVADTQTIPGLESAVMPVVLKDVSTETSNATSGTATKVTGGYFTVPKGFFCPGRTFRFTCAGTRTGTAGATTLLIDIGGSTLITIANPSNTAVDFLAQFIVTEYTDYKHQKAYGYVMCNGTAPAIDYATGTLDVTNDVVISLQLNNANSSDTSYVEHVTVETWVK